MVTGAVGAAPEQIADETVRPSTQYLHIEARLVYHRTLISRPGRPKALAVLAGVAAVGAAAALLNRWLARRSHESAL
jgi:hypothetical protein